MSDYIILPRATVEQALEALKKNTKHLPVDFDYHFEALAALRAALAQQAEPVEPVSNEALRLAGLALIGLAEHDQHCDVFDLDDQGRHKACTCGLNDAIAVITQAGKSAPPRQAEPDHETRAELAEQQVVQLAEERDHYRNLWQKAQQAEPVTIERLRDALVASRIIPPAAVEDPDGYDDGVTLFRIEALHRRLT